MWVSEGSLEEVRREAAGAIVEVVGEYTALRRSGNRYFGLCPFHSERTPSFSVTPDVGLFYCHGCHAGGDALGFLMDIEGLSFVEAAKALGERCGVAVEDADESPESRREREDEARREAGALRALSFAARYYHRVLTGSEAGSAARSYLEERGVSREVTERFGIGYSPGAGVASPGGGLEKFAVRQGASVEALREAGLLNRDGERFYGRLVFPIENRRGRAVGFGARVLEKDKDSGAAKYLNSPESALFKKGSTLYGLPQAADTIRREGRVLVVEGYTDVIACHQAGAEEAVGVLGTSLTEAHLKTLSRLASRIICLFDPDEAGERAAERAASAAAALKLDVRVLRLSRDPADWLAGEDNSEALRRLADEASPVLDFAARRLADRVRGAGAAERSAALEDARGIAASIDDPVLLREALRVLSGALEVSERDIASPGRGSRLGSVGGNGKQNRGSPSPHLQAGREVLQAMTYAPEEAAPFVRDGVELSESGSISILPRDFVDTEAGGEQAALFGLLAGHTGEPLEEALADERLRPYLSGISSLVDRCEREGVSYGEGDVREVWLRLLAFSRQRDYRRAEDIELRQRLYSEYSLLLGEIQGD